MSAAPAKFTFDLDLGRRAERNSVVTESAMATMLADARTAGFAEGFAAGEQGVAAKSAKALSTAATMLADRVGAMSAALDDSKKATLADAVELAAAIARKLAGTLVAREPAAEIEALIAECLASLDGVPHLVIRCNTDLADSVREIAQTRMSTSGFTGRLVVMGDPEIPLGDGRIEWVDGGLVRDMVQLTQDIDARISAFLAAKGINPGAERPEETEQ
jgi:flagellar assembly protein FliH